MSQTSAILKRLQGVHRLTQVELETLTGIPQPRLSRWSAGAAPGPVEDGLKLKALLDKLDAKKRA